MKTRKLSKVERVWKVCLASLRMNISLVWMNYFENSDVARFWFDCCIELCRFIFMYLGTYCWTVFFVLSSCIAKIVSILVEEWVLWLAIHCLRWFRHLSVWSILCPQSNLLRCLLLHSNFEEIGLYNKLVLVHFSIFHCTSNKWWNVNKFCCTFQEQVAK